MRNGSPLSLSGRRAISPAGPDAGNAGFQICVDSNTPVDCDSGRFGERGQWPHADPDDDEIGVESLAATEADTPVRR
jgi:hypothetical protein